MNHLNKTFDSFFAGEAKVAVIKGEWGVGKTYFWENYISGRIDKSDLTQLAYSYISLFGKSSLNDVRKSVFHSAKAISSDSKVDEAFAEEYDNSSKLFNKIPWIKEGLEKAQSKAPLLNWFSKNSQNIPIIGKYSGMISTLEYSLVKNYIICFDDMERKSKSLSVKEVMGLVDELVQRKNCKVVLIFNENSFDSTEDQNQFEIYREKVVDIEINHNPTCRENLRCIFEDDFEGFSLLENVVNELGIKNIRVLRKLKWLYEAFSIYFESKDKKIRNEFILHAAILCWGYYIRDKDLSYDLLKEQLINQSWLSILSDKEKELPIGQKKYRELATNLELSESVFDSHICFYLENGFLQEDLLKQIIIKFEERIKVDSASERLRKAWDIYSTSFSDNLDTFKAELRLILNNEIKFLSLSEFSSALDLLEEFGDNISEYVAKYLDFHSEALKKIDTRHSWSMVHIKCNALKKELEKLHNESKKFNIDDTSIKIATSQGWNHEDIDFLSSISKEDYKTWMKGDPDNLVDKIRSGLLFFKDLGTSNPSDKEKYEIITNNVVGALQEIASENEFNKKRVKYIYGIEAIRYAHKEIS